MADLRLRLIAALHAADCGCQDTPTHFAAQYTPQGDAALTVFAEWLREQAETLRTPGGWSSGDADRDTKLDALGPIFAEVAESLADMVAPKAKS